MPRILATSLAVSVIIPLFLFTPITPTIHNIFLLDVLAVSSEFISPAYVTLAVID